MSAICAPPRGPAAPARRPAEQTIAAMTAAHADQLAAEQRLLEHLDGRAVFAQLGRPTYEYPPGVSRSSTRSGANETYGRDRARRAARPAPTTRRRWTDRAMPAASRALAHASVARPARCRGVAALHVEPHGGEVVELLRERARARQSMPPKRTLLSTRLARPPPAARKQGACSAPGWRARRPSAAARPSARAACGAKRSSPAVPASD